ncbi:hypothetical protein [Massilia sp. 9096]|uniref:hypothetical protein n=1 Tax=Massilia sp. 9096 TaxID=1500894 RepID=UPI00055BA4DC
MRLSSLFLTRHGRHGRRISGDNDHEFAGLGAVIVIGPLFEHLVFRSIEGATVGRGGMQR